MLFGVSSLYGQKFDFFTEEAYLRYPNHIEFGMGASNFLGDLGGKDKVGTNDFQDLEVTEFNVAAFIGWRHAFQRPQHHSSPDAFRRLPGREPARSDLPDARRLSPGAAEDPPDLPRV